MTDPTEVTGKRRKGSAVEFRDRRVWIPAFAGMTSPELDLRLTMSSPEAGLHEFADGFFSPACGLKAGSTPAKFQSAWRGDW